MARVVSSVIVIGIFGFYIIPSFLADRLAREENFARAIAIAPHRSEYALGEASSLIEKDGDARHITNLLNDVKYFSEDLDYRPYFYEAMMLRKKHEYSKSFLAFEEAIRRSPIVPAVYKGYGEALLESGDSRGALVQFNRYVDLAPRTRDRVFYKLNPDFDEIFDLIHQASIAK